MAPTATGYNLPSAPAAGKSSVVVPVKSVTVSSKTGFSSVAMPTVSMSAVSSPVPTKSVVPQVETGAASAVGGERALVLVVGLFVGLVFLV